MSGTKEPIQEMSGGQEEVAILPIPAEHAPAVIEFVENLEHGDHDVRGHMIPVGGAVHREYTMTKCRSTTSSVLISDWTCGDSDTNEL